MHEISDIHSYLTNQRDFKLVEKTPRDLLNEKRVYDDHIRIWIRCLCFAGQQLRIDNKICSFSIQAIKQVLEEDGPHFSNIITVVFTLPIFSKMDIEDQSSKAKLPRTTSFIQQKSHSQY